MRQITDNNARRRQRVSAIRTVACVWCFCWQKETISGGHGSPAGKLHRLPLRLAPRWDDLREDGQDDEGKYEETEEEQKAFATEHLETIGREAAEALREELPA